MPTAKWAWLVGVAKPLPPAHSSIRYLCAPYAKYSLRQTSMQTVGRSPDISVMWRTEYYAGAGYIRHVAVKQLNGVMAVTLHYFNEFVKRAFQLRTICPCIELVDQKLASITHRAVKLVCVTKFPHSWVDTKLSLYHFVLMLGFW